MGVPTRHRPDTPRILNRGAMHKYAAPRIGEAHANEALLESLRMQDSASQLDPSHRRRARRRRVVRRAVRLMLLVVVVALAVAAWRYVPFTEWWDSVQDASTEG